MSEENLRQMSWHPNFGYYIFGATLSRGLHNSRNDWVLALDFGKYGFTYTVWKEGFKCPQPPSPKK